MRLIMTAAILAILTVAASAASVGLPYEDRGSKDACAKNNADTPFSCFTVGSPETPTMFYIDSGRADAWPGVWEEDNTWDGLQKTLFYQSGKPVPADLDLLG